MRSLVDFFLAVGENAKLVSVTFFPVLFFSPKIAL
jgi:hypothetical protein